MSVDRELQGRFSAEFRHAEAVYLRARLLQLLSGLIAAVGVGLSAAAPSYALFSGVTLSAAQIVYALTLLAVLCSLASAWCGHRSKSQRAVAEEARRSYMLCYGLGWPMSQLRRADLLAEFRSTPEEGRKLEADDYFASSLPAGASRLREISQENIFWTRWLCEESARATWAWFALALCVLTGLLLLVPLLPTGVDAVRYCYIISIGLAMLITSDLQGRARAYNKAATALKVIDRDLERIRWNPDLDADTLHLFLDYNSIAEVTPTVPTQVYLKMRSKLNQLWAQRCKAIDQSPNDMPAAPPPA